MERWVRAVICGSMLAAVPVSARAGTCALCRQALASGGGAGLIQGFYWSILLIAGVPLVIMTVVGLAVWRQRRQRMRARDVHRTPDVLACMSRSDLPQH